MKDFIHKLRILLMLLRSSFEEWKIQIYDHNLDDPICCNGYDCGCQGMTIRETYSLKEIKD